MGVFFRGCGPGGRGVREEKESLPPCGLVHAGFRLAGPPLPGPLSRRAYKGGEGYANRRRTLQLPPLHITLRDVD